MSWSLGYKVTSVRCTLQSHPFVSTAKLVLDFLHHMEETLASLVFPLYGNISFAQSCVALLRVGDEAVL
jgi:hypothetical protein